MLARSSVHPDMVLLVWQSGTVAQCRGGGGLGVGGRGGGRGPLLLDVMTHAGWDAVGVVRQVVCERRIVEGVEGEGASELGRLVCSTRGQAVSDSL